MIKTEDLKVGAKLLFNKDSYEIMYIGKQNVFMESVQADGNTTESVFTTRVVKSHFTKAPEVMTYYCVFYYHPVHGDKVATRIFFDENSRTGWIKHSGPHIQVIDTFEREVTLP